MEQATVNAGFIILGIIGGTIYLCMTIFYYRIVKNMEKNRETAIAKFFLKDQALKAFKTLAASGLILVLIFTLEIYGMATENNTAATIARILYPLAMTGLTYFPYTLQKVTKQN
ncbi:MAG: hypothetical protein BRC30_01530 [Nanohaloarchaea archaeon SW_7_46_7]|nr:MAG: hypothetical protein BRC30_01530 [Nanohaloarchaea archaeon SW_7_46_7]